MRADGGCHHIREPLLRRHRHELPLAIRGAADKRKQVGNNPCLRD